MIKIIPFEKDYLNDYVGLYITTWREEPYGEDFSPNDVYLQIDNGDQIYLLVSDRSLVGFAGGRPLAQNCEFFEKPKNFVVGIEDVFYISELAVRKDYRSCGFGNLLMQFLISAAKSQGFNHIVLRTHASPANPAVPLYYKLGMKPLLRDLRTVHSVSVKQKRIDARLTSDNRVYYHGQLTAQRARILTRPPSASHAH